MAQKRYQLSGRLGEDSLASGAPQRAAVQMFQDERRSRFERKIQLGRNFNVIE
jgi:hypothetical protein